jgi:hypothetical protein
MAATGHVAERSVGMVADAPFGATTSGVTKSLTSSVFIASDVKGG